jgi:superfamily I DNA/RNA helicase
VIVAHNGYDFDFPILRRMVHDIAAPFGLCTYDSLPLARELFPTSCRLVDLARRFGVPSGTSHRALDDTTALAKVLLALGESKASRARKTALADLLGHLGVALALAEDETLSGEARRFRNYARPFALGRYSTCLDFYEREQTESGDATLPAVDEIIDRLGGVLLMLKIRAEKTADERYPAAMSRLRRLISDIPGGTLAEQLPLFLERAVLSKWDGDEPDRGRVNLLTLHSTKGLEFSRVYIVGAEDEQLPGSHPKKPPTLEETEEARRLLYVGMTRTVDRLVLTYTAERGGKPSGGHQFLGEMGLTPGVTL